MLSCYRMLGCACAALLFQFATANFAVANDANVSIDTPTAGVTVNPTGTIGVGGYYTSDVGDNIQVEYIRISGSGGTQVGGIRSSTNIAIVTPLYGIRWSGTIGAYNPGAGVTCWMRINVYLRTATHVELQSSTEVKVTGS
jgi:hypothetical protein